MEEISLKEYFETKIDGILTLIESNNKLYNEKFNSSKEAVTKAEVATEKRFESVNEFRNTLTDQQRTFIPRAEAEVKFGGFDKSLDSIQNQLNKEDGKNKGKTEGWGFAIGIFGFIVAIIALIGRFF